MVSGTYVDCCPMNDVCLNLLVNLLYNPVGDGLCEEMSCSPLEQTYWRQYLEDHRRGDTVAQQLVKFLPHLHHACGGLFSNNEVGHFVTV